MKVKSVSEAAQSCPTLSDLMACSPPGSFLHGILQAGVLEWGVIAFSIRGAQIPLILWASLKVCSFPHCLKQSLGSAPPM